MAKILIVDDAAFMRKVIRDMLAKNGYDDVTEAVDGKDAVEKYFEIKPNLVLMDITMPNMDGLLQGRQGQCGHVLRHGPGGHGGGGRAGRYQGLYRQAL